MSINNEFNMVKDFHKAFGHPVSEKPTLISEERAKVRYSWMLEEINEFLEATKNGDIYEMTDAMIDEIYFALGTLVEMGIPPAQIFETVQNANMSKLWPDGKPHYKSDGKVVKPSNWKDPHDKIVKIIDQMSEDS
jgi:predicted HAD superfamily Cof-like phosphohydrolase